ncbi:hypothetical protein LP420_00255 [Massilia sp. B-10]|nr:hypothetical protein LP420_00255 [Massilia sp. B-10]
MQLKHASLVLSLLAAFSANAFAQSCPANGTGLSYPDTRKVEQKDSYHGTVIADPYRWLEDADSADTKAWVEAQNKVTQSVLGQIP